MEEILDGFQMYYSLAQISGLLALVILFYWLCSYMQSFSFSGSALFNWHPLFMTIGMIYLLGNALMVFRVFRNKPKPTLKLIHTSINVIAFLFGLFGFLAVYVYHNQNNFPNFYSLHSWIGIVALLGYLTQGVLGYTTFLFPGFSSQFRAWLYPRHVYFGHFVFVAATIAAISGLNEKAFIAPSVAYSSYGSQTWLVNLTGLLFLAFAGLVVYITTNAHYKRYPRPAESELVRAE